MRKYTSIISLLVLFIIPIVVISLLLNNKIEDVQQLKASKSKEKNQKIILEEIGISVPVEYHQAFLDVDSLVTYEKLREDEGLIRKEVSFDTEDEDIILFSFLWKDISYMKSYQKYFTDSIQSQYLKKLSESGINERDIRVLQRNQYYLSNRNSIRK
ncbi:MAG: hypothetical protein ACEPOV_14090 [Hyphomicrobiales bacterium]